MTGGSRTVCLSVANWAMAPTNGTCSVSPASAIFATVDWAISSWRHDEIGVITGLTNQRLAP
jgi:hypothetical protein